MPITTAEILFKFSVVAAAGNTTAGTPAGALGDQISTTQITDATLNNLFDDVSGDENAASDVEYRCFFVHNSNATLTWSNVVAWISGEVAGGANAAISIDSTGITPVGSASPQAKTIADENTAPVTQTFTSPTTKATALAIGNMGPGTVQGIWVRRSATNSAAQNSDGVTIRVEGDSPA